MIIFLKLGNEYNLKPGAPNHPERIEGGLLSYGNDMLIGDNPFECGFDNYVNLDSDVFFSKGKFEKNKKKELIESLWE